MLRVTIVTSTYNHEKFVGGMIESVLNQTYADFEFIIIDDASTDSTASVVEKYNDSRIKFIRYTTNTAAEAFLHGINQTTGELIAVIGSDDMWKPDKLQKQVEFLDVHPHVSAVFTFVDVVDDALNIVTNHPYHHVFRRDNRSRQEWLNHFFWKGNCLCHPSVLMRRACYNQVGPYDIRLMQLPDYDIWIGLCLKYEIFIIQEQLTIFRLHTGNTSALTDAARGRVPYEMYKLLTRFLSIPTIEDLHKIFPESKTMWTSFNKDLIPFYVAMVALTSRFKNYKFFGIDTLYHLLGDPVKAKLLRDVHSFGRRQYVDLVASSSILPFEV